MGTFKRLLHVINHICVVIGFVAIVLIFSPGLPPYDVEYIDHPLPPAQIKFEGPLSPNNLLDNAQLLSSKIDNPSIGYLKGIESFAVHDGYLYSGVQGGDIVRLPLSDPVKQQWTVVTKIGQACDGLHEEAKCGRPLGLEFDSKGRLFVADSYYGLYRVDVAKKTKEALVPIGVEIEGKHNLVTNSLAITKDDKTIFFTTSSTNFPLTNGMYEIMAAPSGRVLQYDVAKNTSKVIMDGLSFANGIVLSPKEDFLLICETGNQRVWKYHLTGDKTGQKEVFATLPGAVDNIKSNGADGYIVGIIVPKLPEKFYLLWHIRAKAFLCKFLVRLCVFVQTLLQAITDHVFPSHAIEMLIHKIGNTEYMGANILPAYALLVELDATGKMTRSWHSNGQTIDKICEGFIHDGFMYLGSPYNLYVARVPYSNPTKA